MFNWILYIAQQNWYLKVTITFVNVAWVEALLKVNALSIWIIYFMMLYIYFFCWLMVGIVKNRDNNLIPNKGLHLQIMLLCTTVSCSLYVLHLGWWDIIQKNKIKQNKTSLCQIRNIIMWVWTPLKTECLFLFISHAFINAIQQIWQVVANVHISNILEVESRWVKIENWSLQQFYTTWLDKKFILLKNIFLSLKII